MDSGSLRLCDYPTSIVRLSCRPFRVARLNAQVRLAKIFQPGGENVRTAAQPLKQASRSDSQFGPITTGDVCGATCWVPTVGKIVTVPRTLTHVTNVARQLGEQSNCTILFFGMGVKLPAKLVWIDAKRIIAAKLSFIFIPIDLKVCTRLNGLASSIRSLGTREQAMF